MRLTVVGCSGSFPGPTSAASCYLLEARDEGDRTWRVLLDLGSGALGPLQRHIQLQDVDAVLLSHLHPDHCLDLCGFYVALKYQPIREAAAPVTVYGPAGTAERMARAYDLPVDPGMSGTFEFCTWSEAAPVQLGPFTVTPRRVVHPVTAYAMRIEGPGEDGGRRTLVYTGDSDTCPALDEISRGADLLLAEAAFQEGRDTDRGIHLTGLRAGQLAATAGAARLVLTHLPPWTDPRQTRQDAEAAYPGPVTLAEPGAVHLL